MWTDEGTSLVREGVECASGDEDLGTFADIQSCAAACRLATGCNFFVFGKLSKIGRCWHEHTATRECSQGWEDDEFDFYELRAGEHDNHVKMMLRWFLVPPPPHPPQDTLLKFRLLSFCVMRVCVCVAQVWLRADPACSATSQTPTPSLPPSRLSSSLFPPPPRRWRQLPAPRVPAVKQR